MQKPIDAEAGGLTPTSYPGFLSKLSIKFTAFLCVLASASRRDTSTWWK